MTTPVPHPVEEDQVPALKLFVLSVLLVVVVGGCIIGLQQTFMVGARIEMERKAAQFPTTDYEVQREAELRELDNYGVADATKGVYRIPIDRAMKLVVEDPQLATPVGPKP